MRAGFKQKAFCNGTIEIIEPGQKRMAGYFLIKEHSYECQSLTRIPNKKELSHINDKDHFFKQ